MKRSVLVGEFDLIERYFRRPVRPDRPIQKADLGVGDDCALLSVAPGMQLAVSTDSLVEGRHFLSTVPPERLGHKALAVNLSDLAACGAEPLAFTLALGLPQVQADWLQAFAQGLLDLADAHGIELIGGDTTRGPLNIGITVLGQLPKGLALLRSGAQVGDDVYVSGQLGEARAALEVFRHRLHLPTELFELARHRLECPVPRLALGQALRGVAHSAIDLSDGLCGDLQHVLRASGLGAVLDLGALHRGLVQTSAVLSPLPLPQALQWVLSGGDDYELLFTAAPARRAHLQSLAQSLDLRLTRIGELVAQPGLRLQDDPALSVSAQDLDLRGFDHFS